MRRVGGRVVFGGDGPPAEGNLPFERHRHARAQVGRLVRRPADMQVADKVLLYRERQIAGLKRGRADMLEIVVRERVGPVQMRVRVKKTSVRGALLEYDFVVVGQPFDVSHLVLLLF